MWRAKLLLSESDSVCVVYFSARAKSRLVGRPLPRSRGSAARGCSWCSPFLRSDTREPLVYLGENTTQSVSRERRPLLARCRYILNGIKCFCVFLMLLVFLLCVALRQTLQGQMGSPNWPGAQNNWANDDKEANLIV